MLLEGSNAFRCKVQVLWRGTLEAQVQRLGVLVVTKGGCRGHA